MTATTQPAPAKPSASRRPRASMHLKLDRTDVQSRRMAAAILEVLAGVRTPTDAAKVLSISLPAYYKLESRALSALVAGCRPVGRGPRPSAEVQVGLLRRRCQRLEQEVQRYQALARTAQRTAGLAPPPLNSKEKDAKGRRHRRPSVRALRAVEAIRKVVPESAPSAASPSADGLAG